VNMADMVGVDPGAAADQICFQISNNHGKFPFQRVYHKAGNSRSISVSIVPEYCRRYNYPFTEPTITPLVKYFCRKGYTIKIGTVETTMTAILTLCWGTT